MELTFVNQYSGDAPKRRRLARACETCRARKKRCVHFADSEFNDDSRARSQSPDDALDNIQVNGNTNGVLRKTSRNSISAAGLSQQQTPPSSARGSNKFVSDLCPQSALLDRPVPGDSSQKQPNDDIGVWVDRNEWDALVKQRDEAVTVSNSGFRYHQRPHSAVLGPLIDIYFKKIQPILPLLDEDEFRRNHARGVVPEALVYAVCLVAAKDPEAEPHLKLSDSSTTVSARRFCSMLHGSVSAGLRVPVRFEKITLIRILALTSLHSEGADGAEEASLWLTQACHHAQTIGIHLGQQAASATGNELVMKRLFWSLWAMDRASAAINGRPIIMNDFDIAIEPFAPGESGYPALEVWLKIANVLNQIIAFYRPTNDVSATGWEDPYPTLEALIDEVGGWELSPSVLATIHLFYLVVGVLSHRTRGMRARPRNIQASYLRQRLNAIEIVRLMNAPKSPTLHPLPILPYAISLALSVSYQHLRQSQFEHQQADARQDFRTACAILQNLRRTWSSADVMAQLAKKVLEQLDKSQDLASFRIPRNRMYHHKEEDDLIPPPTACNHGAGAMQTMPDTEANVNLDDTNQQTDAIAAVPAVNDQQPMGDGFDLFDNMDDVFGTFMDPNYPLNLDDFSWIDNLSPLDWSTEVTSGT